MNVSEIKMIQYESNQTFADIFKKKEKLLLLLKEHTLFMDEVEK